MCVFPLEIGRVSCGDNGTEPSCLPWAVCRDPRPYPFFAYLSLGGTDLAREERIQRCRLASDLLISALTIVQQLSVRPGALGWHASDLRLALERFCTMA